MHIGSNRLVITIEPITIHSDLPKDVEKILKYETDSIIKHNDFLAEHTIKTKSIDYYSNISMENDIHEHGKPMNHKSFFLICHKD